MEETKITYNQKMPIRSFSVQRYFSPFDHDFDIGKRKPSFSLLYVVRGEVSFYTMGRSIRGEAGDFFYIPYGIRYHSKWSGKEGTEHYCVHAVPADPLYEDPYPLQKISSLATSETLDALKEIYSKKEQGEDHEAEIIAAFFSLYAKALPFLKKEEREIIPELLVRAVNYIESHYTEPLTVPNLAAFLGVSESSVYHLFLKELKTSPIKYHNHYRLERVIAEFGSDFTIEEIAYRNGFESYGYFRGLFKAHTGMTPRQYRKRKYG